MNASTATDYFGNIDALRTAIAERGFKTENMSEIGMPQFVAFEFFGEGERRTLWVGQDAAIGEAGDDRFTVWQTPYTTIEQIIDGFDGHWVRLSIVNPDLDSLMAVADLAGSPVLPLTHAPDPEGFNQSACTMHYSAPLTDPVAGPGEDFTCYSCVMQLG